MKGLLLCILASCVVAAAQRVEEPYRLETGDLIEVRFFYTPDLNDKIQIRPDGRITLGLIGEVMVAGRTVGELTSYLQKRYAEQLKDPAIAVQVLSFANRKVFVGGEVVRPGLIALTGEQTVLGAILEAGGVTRQARRGYVLLVRKSAAGAPETLRLTLERKGEPAAQAAATFLRPFDVVIVTESTIARMNRAVDQYVFKFIPQQLTFGFTYLLNGGVVF